MKVPHVSLNFETLSKTQDQIIDKALKIIKEHKFIKDTIQILNIKDEEIIEHLVEFLNLKDALDYPTVYPWYYTLTRDPKTDELIFNRTKAKNDYSKNITRSINLLYTKITSPSIDSKISKIRQTSAIRKELINKIKILRTSAEKKKPTHTFKSIYLYGGRGCGKSYICAALANSFSMRGISSIYTKTRDLYSFLTKKISDENGTYKTILNDFENVSLLIIDDLGLEKNSDWFRFEVLAPILKYRNEHNKLTILSSPMNMADLSKYYLSFAKDPVQKYNIDSLLYDIKYNKDEYNLD
ncbi:ATP-binding protein [Mycoplasmopsis felifaucium]|uniref:ATP-binding protein n=1 Tax=Mycoplasmopsis felifaucium TaxID=35768 RepID=UPI00068FF09A|nr:ATP-binding protein [Mycoplasmopsis felifaucium]